MAISQKADRFVKAMIGRATEDIQRGAHAEYYHSMAHDGSEQPTPQTPPLKRHAALQPLSREHMAGLIQARNLRRAADIDEAGRTRAITEFVHAWRTEIRPHFDDEERLLLPLVRSPTLRGRLLDEHAALRRLAEQCERNPGAVARDPELVRHLGNRLHDHIRWEERDFFEAVQRDQPEALAALAPQAALIEAQRPGSRARHTLAGDDHDAGRTEEKP